MGEDLPGNLMIGTYYYPEQWPSKDWAADFKRMRAMGLRHVHMAEFAWVQLEPREGEFRFDWLDAAVDLAEANDLDIILCTPTATPPVWVALDYPDALMVRANGRRVTHGSRAQRCVNAPAFNRLAGRITTKMAQRYGQLGRVIGWQLDNEIGHYVNAPCHCPACERAFRQYLQARYGEIGTLNQAWGTDFWSQNYDSFDQIALPNPETLAYLPNEHALLDFRRFFSRSQARFLERQATLLRRHIAARAWVTHNFIAGDNQVHPRHVTGGLDLFTLTLYPVAGRFSGRTGAECFRIGDPMALAFHHDFARGHNGRWGVMEQQPGQVNWGPHNCRPFPGAVRLWLWTAVAHGAELLDTYRFRQPRCGCEQYHAGLIHLDGTSVTAGGREFSQVAAELETLAALVTAPTSSGAKMQRAAILHDWESLTALAIHPQTDRFDPVAAWLRYYAALKQLGFEVVVLSPERRRPLDLSRYAVLCVPYVDLVAPQWLAEWSRYVDGGGHLILSARSATRDRKGHFPKTRYGQWVMDLVGARLEGYDVLPVGQQGRIALPDGSTHPWEVWAEQWQPPADAEILATFGDQFYAGRAAAFQRDLGEGRLSLIGVDAAGLTERLVQTAIISRRPDRVPLPENCLFHTRGELGIFLNYADRPVRVPDHLHRGAPPLVGELNLPPAGVCIWRISGISRPDAGEASCSDTGGVL